MTTMLKRYGPQLLKLPVLVTEHPNYGHPVRVENDSGYYLDINVYSETVYLDTEIWFQMYGTEQAPIHALPITTLYLTKDYLQQKWFQVQSAGTTYVYDYPDMFRQMVSLMWE